MPDERPDWYVALKVACEAEGQTAVAKRLDVCKATVSLLLSGKYGARTEHLEARIRAVLMKATCQCPVLGEIPLSYCHEQQGPLELITSHLTVQLYRACQTCPNSRSNATASQKPLPTKE